MEQQDNNSPSSTTLNGYATSTQDSLGARYVWKVLANLVGLGSGLIVQATVPRALGPTLYGDYSFLTNFFSRFVGSCNMGTALAFYSKLSQRPNEYKLVAFYLYFVLAIAVITAFFLAGSYLFSVEKYLWPDQQWIFICGAALWAFWTWTSDVINRMTDAYALTVQSEKARIGQKVFAAGLILGLFFLDWLSLATFFAYQYLILMILCLIWMSVLKNNGRSLLQNGNLSRAEMTAYGREFYIYSSPLVTYSMVGFFVNVLDRWLLQKYAGSAEQGFFGFSYQIGAICFLFTGSMTPLIMREFSVAFSNKNMHQMAILFRRYIPSLYAVATFFACFIAVEASRVVDIFGGSRFSAAVPTVFIMAFYPTHQTYGQLSGSVFYATEQMSLYRNIGIAAMLFGVPLTFLFVASQEHGGLNAGAAGLALKMVLVQFLAVNIQLFFNSRLLKLSFLRILGHQIICPMCLLTLAFAVHLSITNLLVEQAAIPGVLTEGLLYTGLAIAMGYYFPSLFGLRREDVSRLISTCSRLCRFN